MVVVMLEVRVVNFFVFLNILVKYELEVFRFEYTLKRERVDAFSKKINCNK